MRAIIPCAGFGNRMGMKLTQSKEFLEDTRFGYRHIIDYSINLCKFFKLDPLIITRKAKKDLIKYCKDNQIEYMIHEPKEGEEWNHTVLASKDHWSKDNLLMLPDTRFNSIFAIDDIKRCLELRNNAVVALHKVKDPQNWCIIKNYVIQEKPQITGEFWAFGLIGFKESYGHELFSEIKYKKLENVGFTYLTSFIDITRGK